MKATVVELNQRDVFNLDLLRSQGHSVEGALRIASAARPWGRTAWWTPMEDQSVSEDEPR
jgi:hypothetical protein